MMGGTKIYAKDYDKIKIKYKRKATKENGTDKTIYKNFFRGTFCEKLMRFAKCYLKLDKYMNDKHVDYSTKQEREQEERGRYGNLLDHAKPNNKIYDDMLNVDNMCRKIRQQRADKYEQENRRRQERIEREKQNLQERKDKHETFANDFLNKKEA